MSERTRDFLKPEFKDGERPSGADFADLIDSFAWVRSHHQAGVPAVLNMSVAGSISATYMPGAAGSEAICWTLAIAK